MDNLNRLMVRYLKVCPITAMSGLSLLIFEKLTTTPAVGLTLDASMARDGLFVTLHAGP